jgi:Domain of unknown function (DUF4156)/Short C-terminal domain
MAASYRLIVFSVLGLAAFCSCSTALTAQGSNVRVAKSAHANCTELGIVYGSGGGGGYTSAEGKMESAQNELRNKTARMGGNLVVLDAAGGDATSMSMSGRAFDCGKEGPVEVAVVDDQTQMRHTESQSAQPNAEDRLRKLQELLEKGLITQEEHDKRKAEILDSI